MSSTVKLNEECSLCQQIWLAHSSRLQRHNLTVFLGSYSMEGYINEKWQQNQKKKEK